MPQTPAQPAPASPAISARGALTALIVDDEVHVRTYLRLILKALGVTTIWEAKSGVEGLSFYMEYQPSVVLLDINMPVMPGDVMMARLTAIDPEAAVIVVTSEGKSWLVRYFRELGAIGYVLKHSPREEAQKMIGEALDHLLSGGEEG